MKRSAFGETKKHGKKNAVFISNHKERKKEKFIHQNAIGSQRRLDKPIYQNGIEYMDHLTRSYPPTINPEEIHSNSISASSRLALFNLRTLQQIPILKTMGISFTHYENGQLRVDMPLLPNINDKKTAFGGSIVTLATISGWALPSLLLNGKEWRYDVLIGEGSTKYLAPVVADCYSLVKLRNEDLLKLSTDLSSNRKARLNIAVDIFVDQTKTASFNGTYHVKETKRGEQQTSTSNE